jgi:two-component system CheB/CheR fusion protein
MFELIDRDNKIYLKRPSVSRPPIHFSPEDFRTAIGGGTGRPQTRNVTPVDFQREADRFLLGRYAPPGVLVNENFDIVQFRGRTSPYLEQPPGEPTNNVLKMAREGLFLELRKALTAAAKQRESVLIEPIRVRSNGGIRMVSVEVMPIYLPSSTHACFLVLFHDSRGDPDISAPAAIEAAGDRSAPAPANAQEVEQLRKELERRRNTSSPSSSSKTPRTKSSVRPTKRSFRRMKNYRAPTKS